MNSIKLLVSIWRENTGIDKLKFLFSSIIWQIRKRLKHTFVKKLHTGASIKILPFSAYSGIFYFKWPEKQEQLFIRKHKYLAPIFVDVGANVGIFSLHVFDCFKSFYLFEPSLQTFKALEQTCSLNPTVQWNLFNVGVADQSGCIEFIEEGQLSSTNRFSSTVQKAKADDRVSVKVETLDNLIREEVGDIVLKVDVEGFEEKVFNGARRIFSRQQAKLVMFERLGRTNLQNLKEFFKLHNYVVFVVEKNGSINTNEDAISVPLINLFAAPADIFLALGTKI